MTGGRNHAGPDGPTSSDIYTIRGHEQGNGGGHQNPAVVASAPHHEIEAWPLCSVMGHHKTLFLHVRT